LTAGGGGDRAFGEGDHHTKGERKNQRQKRLARGCNKLFHWEAPRKEKDGTGNDIVGEGAGVEFITPQTRPETLVRRETIVMGTIAMIGEKKKET